jgi:hypothetical protein
MAIQELYMRASFCRHWVVKWTCEDKRSKEMHYEVISPRGLHTWTQAEDTDILIDGDDNKCLMEAQCASVF